jgi:hypothetical protein
VAGQRQQRPHYGNKRRGKAWGEEEEEGDDDEEDNNQEDKDQEEEEEAQLAKEEEKTKEDDNNLTRETNGMPTLTPLVWPWTRSRSASCRPLPLQATQMLSSMMTTTTTRI